MKFLGLNITYNVPDSNLSTSFETEPKVLKTKLKLRQQYDINETTFLLTDRIGLSYKLRKKQRIQANWCNFCETHKNLK